MDRPDLSKKNYVKNQQISFTRFLAAILFIVVSSILPSYATTQQVKHGSLDGLIGFPAVSIGNQWWGGSAAGVGAWAKIGGGVGGITIQLYNHRTGFLVNSIEGAAYRIRYILNRPEVARKIGKKAKLFVSDNYLITRHLRDYLALFSILENPGKNIIQV